MLTARHVKTVTYSNSSTLRNFEIFYFLFVKDPLAPFARNKDSNLLDPKTEEKIINLVTSMANKYNLFNP